MGSGRGRIRASSSGDNDASNRFRGPDGSCVEAKDGFLATKCRREHCPLSAACAEGRGKRCKDCGTPATRCPAKRRVPPGCRSGARPAHIHERLHPSRSNMCYLRRSQVCPTYLRRRVPTRRVTRLRRSARSDAMIASVLVFVVEDE